MNVSSIFLPKCRASSDQDIQGMPGYLPLLHFVEACEKRDGYEDDDGLFPMTDFNLQKRVNKARLSECLIEHASRADAN